MKLSKILKLSYLFFLTIGLMTCTEETEVEVVPEEETLTGIPFSGSAIAAKNVKPISEADWEANVNAVTKDQITFKENITEITNFETGDIIVGEKGEGYLRKVVNIEKNSGNLIVKTQDATIEEVFENADLNLALNLNPDNILSSKITEGLYLQTSNQEEGNGNSVKFEYQIERMKLEDLPIELKGNFSIETQIKLENKIRDSKLEELKFTYDVDLNSELTAIIGDVISEEIERQKTLVKHSFEPTKVSINNIPIIVQPILKVNVGIKAKTNANTHYGFNHHVSFKKSLTYPNDDPNDKWKLEGDDSEENTKIPSPSLKEGSTETEVEMYLEPIVELKFYGTMATKLSGMLPAKLTVNSDYQQSGSKWWHIQGKIEMDAQVSGDIFSSDNIASKIYSFVKGDKQEFLNSEGTGLLQDQEISNLAPSIPEPIFPDPTDNTPVNISQGVTFQWETEDLENDRITHRFYLYRQTQDEKYELVLDNAGLLQASFTPASDLLKENQTYKWHIVSSDDEGNSAEGLQWSFTTAPGISAPELQSPQNADNDVKFPVTLEWTESISDNQNDKLLYDIYLDTQNPPLTILNNDGQSLSYRVPNSLLNANTQYYWKIEVKNPRNGVVVPSSIQSFQTTSVKPQNFKPFISVWKTTNTNETIYLPLYSYYEGSYYNFAVDWGDNNYNKLDTIKGTRYNRAYHTYSQPGEYTVTIKGDIKGFNFDKSDQGQDAANLLFIKKWGDLVLGGYTGHFYGCKNFNIRPSDDPGVPNLVETTSFKNFFRRAEKFNYNISHWDTKNITSMETMFYDAIIFNQECTFNTEKVESMRYMFGDAELFDNGGKPMNLNTAKVTNMRGMFSNAKKFNQSFGANFKTDSVTDMGYMFYQNQEFNQTLNFNTDKVKEMDFMFNSASKFNNEGQPLKFNTDNVTTMRGMFHLAKGFRTSIEFTSTQQVRDMDHMFKNAEGFNQDLSNWCVLRIYSQPQDFDKNSGFEGKTNQYPKWGIPSVASCTKK